MYFPGEQMSVLQTVVHVIDSRGTSNYLLKMSDMEPLRYWSFGQVSRNESIVRVCNEAVFDGIGSCSRGLTIRALRRVRRTAERK